MTLLAMEIHFPWHGKYKGLGDGTIEPDTSHAVTVSAFSRSSKYGPPLFLAGSSRISKFGNSVLECNSTACESQPWSSWFYLLAKNDSR